jgi:hypothetical protein
MSSQALESKKFFMEKTQKMINKSCFKRCFSAQNGLDKDCYITCADKMVKTIARTLDGLAIQAKIGRTPYHFRILTQHHPLLDLTYDEFGIRYKIQKPDYVYAYDFGRNRLF